MALLMPEERAASQSVFIGSQDVWHAWHWTAWAIEARARFLLAVSAYASLRAAERAAMAWVRKSVIYSAICLSFIPECSFNFHYR
jgi:hypothetical protein